MLGNSLARTCGDMPQAYYIGLELGTLTSRRWDWSALVLVSTVTYVWKVRMRAARDAG